MTIGRLSSASGAYGPDVAQELTDAAGSSLLVRAAFAARQAIRSGGVDKRELTAAMGDLGVGLGTTIALNVILGGT